MYYEQPIQENLCLSDITGLFSVNSEGHLLVRNLYILGQDSESSSNSPSPALEKEPESVHLSIPKSLKAMVSRSPDNAPQKAVVPSPTPELILELAADLGALIHDSIISGLTTRNVNDRLRGILWGHREMIVCDCIPGANWPGSKAIDF